MELSNSFLAMKIRAYIRLEFSMFTVNFFSESPTEADKLHRQILEEGYWTSDTGETLTASIVTYRKKITKNEEVCE